MRRNLTNLLGIYNIHFFQFNQQDHKSFVPEIKKLSYQESNMLQNSTAPVKQDLVTII